MTVGIYYFSGTGNTEYVAKKLQAHFADKGITCDLMPMETITLSKETIQLNSYDIIGIGFPVHALDAPSIVYSFIEMLPVQKQEYFLFKTAASKFVWGGSTFELRHKLAEKGWKLKHEAFYKMPSNVFTSAKSAKITSLAKEADVLAKTCVIEICNGDKRILPLNLVMRLAYKFNRFENEGCKHGSALWQAKDTCISCGLCAANCPTANISMVEGKPQFAGECIFCLRCRWQCPVKAIYHRKLERFFVNDPYKLP
jgi:flavodoxin/NAD-dependent dihydropyrimidine dehydrogenase PreA subunit